MEDLDNWVPGISPENIGKLVLVKITDRDAGNGTLLDTTTRKYVGIMEAYYASPTECGVQLRGVSNWQIIKHAAKYMEVIPLQKTS